MAVAASSTTFGPNPVGSPLRLNLLPVAFPFLENDVIYALPRDDRNREDELRRRADDGRAFHVYSFGDRLYLWAHSGQPLPPDVDLSEANASVPSLLPAEVLCFAVRDAVIDRLIDGYGFERVGRGIEGQIRLFRRKHNIAADALGGIATAAGETIDPETGVFPYLGVQCIPLPNSDGAGAKVALVLDAGIVNRLDVPLAELANAGVDLQDVRVVWNHGEHCSCGYEDHRGEAGRIVGGDPRSAVEVAMQGDKKVIPAACLRLLASRQEIDRYFSNKLSKKNVESLIADKVIAFHEPDTQWQLLERTRQLLNPITIFTSTEVTLGEPLIADASGSAGVTVLPPLPAEPPLNFQYGAPILFQGAAIGLNKHGPYDKNVTTRLDQVDAVILCPDQFQADAERLRKALVDGIDKFPGLKDRYELRALKVEVRPFAGSSATDYANAALAATRPAPDGTLPTVVFLITQRRDKNKKQGKNPYLAAKAVLANANVASQAVTIDVIRESDYSFRWVIQSIALQVYAKIGNIPYVLHDEEGAAVNELILGIGRYDVHLPGQGFQQQMFGAASAFRQDGDFLFAGSTVPVADRATYEQTLTELVKEFIERYEQEQGKDLERLTVHIFKRTGAKEVYAVKNAIGGRNIEFALVHVNRDTPLWLVDDSGGAITAAPIGTVVELDDRDRLLMTGEHGSGKRRNPHPLRLTLDRRSTFKDMDRMTRQIQGFTATSWRGFRTTYEPSTILYGRLLAEKVAQLLPYGFDPKRAAAIGGKPWFL